MPDAGCRVPVPDAGCRCRVPGAPSFAVSSQRVGSQTPHKPPFLPVRCRMPGARAGCRCPGAGARVPHPSQFHREGWDRKHSTSHHAGTGAGSRVPHSSQFHRKGWDRKHSTGHHFFDGCRCRVPGAPYIAVSSRCVGIRAKREPFSFPESKPSKAGAPSSARTLRLRWGHSRSARTVFTSASNNPPHPHREKASSRLKPLTAVS
jgi:hypothetical protein